MDYKRLNEVDGKVIVEGLENFDLKHIFECGQCFRWNKVADNRYLGTAFRRTIEVSQDGDRLIIENSSLDDFKRIWEKYFDLERDYGKIKATLSKDPLLKESVEFGYGIRILNQEPFEMLISFIISANNQIPRIKKLVEKVSENWGDEIEYKGVKYYSFPSPLMLRRASLEELKEIGLGFRAKYIYETVRLVTDADKAMAKKIKGEELTEEEEDNLKYHLATIINLNHVDCHKALMNYVGVGPKVADCIMLFSMEKVEAFPVDVWVKKAMQYFYKAPDSSLTKIRKFGQDVFGDLAGFAQQYLFYNARENKIKVEIESPSEDKQWG